MKEKGGSNQLLIEAVSKAATPGSLTRKDFQQLAAVPAEVEWFANLDNPRTRRAYQIDLRDFMTFVGVRRPEDFRLVTRAHLIAWRKHLEARELGGVTIRRKLAVHSSLFEYLCERKAVTHNPVKGVKGPRVKGEKYQALGPYQARDEPSPMSAKAENWRIARKMTLAQLKTTDLGTFLETL